MTATSTSPVIIRPAFPKLSTTSTPSSSNHSTPNNSNRSTPNNSTASTPATTPPQSPSCTEFTATAASRHPIPHSWHFRANPSSQDNSLPKSKTSRLRREEQEWQHTPSTTIQVPPWYTTERAHIQPLRLRIPNSNYTAQNSTYQHQQAKSKPPGALCLMPNASPYPRA